MLKFITLLFVTTGVIAMDYQFAVTGFGTAVVDPETKSACQVLTVFVAFLVIFLIISLVDAAEAVDRRYHEATKSKSKESNKKGTIQ